MSEVREVSDPIEKALGEAAEPARARLLERLRRYVELETPSGDRERINRLAAVIAADLAESGASVELRDAGAAGTHVVARLAGRADLKPLLVMAHLDTVHPVGTLATQPFELKDGRVTGPGIYDMKAGIALVVETLLRLSAGERQSARPVHVLVTCDEEVGSKTSRALIEAEARGAEYTLVVEPCLRGGKAKTARKGVASYRVEVFGKAAHAGIEPERGISAIAELADQIKDVLALADASRGTTVSIGTVQGGTAVNVIPAHAVAEVDVRYTTAAEAERIDRALRALASHGKARVEVIQHDTRPPLQRSAGVIALYERARAIADELGHELGEGSTGGGSDGCFTAALGIPTLDGIGPDGGGAHAIDEHILVDDLPFRMALYTRLMERL